MKIKLLFALFLAGTLAGCKAKSTDLPAQEVLKNSENASQPSEDPAPADTLQRGSDVYPRTGRKAADFVPQNGIYAVQHEATGDLNADGIPDLVVVLENRKDKQQGARPVLVLLGQGAKTYRLDKVSHFVFPVEHNEADFPNYDTEDISIADSALHIQLYGVGPKGNLFSDFRYFGKELLLTAIETYNMGAGGHTQMDYDVLKGSVTVEQINTMEEDMPSETTVYPVKKRTFPFETADPEAIISDVFGEIDTGESDR